jgi:hypothetical protein
MNSNLGWLTESAFLPKESKKIKIEQTSSLVNLKAKLLEQKVQLKQGGPRAQTVVVKQQTNPGVEKRAEKDEVGHEERRMDVSNV